MSASEVARGVKRLRSLRRPLDGLIRGQLVSTVFTLSDVTVGVHENQVSQRVVAVVELFG